MGGGGGRNIFWATPWKKENRKKKEKKARHELPEKKANKLQLKWTPNTRMQKRGEKKGGTEPILRNFSGEGRRVLSPTHEAMKKKEERGTKKRTESGPSQAICKLTQHEQKRSR